jgi:hypothetical protein
MSDVFSAAQFAKPTAPKQRLPGGVLRPFLPEILLGVDRYLLESEFKPVVGTNVEAHSFVSSNEIAEVIVRYVACSQS